MERRADAYAYRDPMHDRPTSIRGRGGVRLPVRPGWTLTQLAALFGGPTPPEKGPRRSFDP